MDSYKRKAVAKSIEIRSRRLKNLKKLLIFIYWFVPITLICFCLFLLYENELIDNPFGKYTKNEQLVSNDAIIVGEFIESTKDEDDIELGKKVMEDSIIHESEPISVWENDGDSIEVNNGIDTVENSNINLDVPDLDNMTPTNIDSNFGKYKDKLVYLTFDDGPSKNTEEILDILAKHDVKASFFVIGKEDEHSIRMYRRIVEEGHALGLHSYSHDYKTVYKSLQDFEKDFTKLRNMLYDTTGYLPNVYRFPGGSATLSNKKLFNKITDYLTDNSIEYYDWNILNGDATGKRYTEEELISNVLVGVDEFDHGIVLMHDSNSKKSTVDSLDKLLQILIENGASIRPIDSSVKPIQQVKKKNQEN